MNANRSSLKRKIVILTLTQNCNLNCIYCFERNKTTNEMSLDVAKHAVEYEFTHSGDFDEIEFDLFGGEPTLRKLLIQQLVEWTELQNFQKPYLFFLETNGTLTHGKFQDWLLEHKDKVYVGLSLDGTPETHNQNRSNSYDKIDTHFFATNYPEQSVRMTIYNETVHRLFSDIVHLHDLGFPEIVATFAHGITWDQAKIQAELATELNKLCQYYLVHPEKAVCSIFDMQLPSIIKKGDAITKWCGTGTNMVSYDTDGKKYPCHTFQPFASENGKAGLGNVDFTGITDFSDSECSRCVIEPICPNCYGMNYVTNGSILKRDKGLCEIVKMRAVATSYFKARQIELNSKVLPPGELYNTIAAIKVIQNSFAKEHSN